MESPLFEFDEERLNNEQDNPNAHHCEMQMDKHIAGFRERDEVGVKEARHYQYNYYQKPITKVLVMICGFLN